MRRIKEPARHPGIPQDALWDKKESCWTTVALDAKGKKHGVARHWYASGNGRGETGYDHGLAHGVETALRGQGEETPFDETFDERVHRAESAFDKGVLLTQKCFAADGAPVGSDGEPMPPRPATVPPEASWIGPLAIWVEGPLEGGKPISGTQRRYLTDGRLVADLRYLKGELDGAVIVLEHDDAETDVGVPKGPPATTRTEAVFERGVPKEAHFFAADGVELASIRYEEGVPHGTLHWRVDRHGDPSAPILSDGNGELEARRLIRPRPPEGTVRVEVDFDHGELLEARAYDAKDGRLAPVPMLTGWGESTKKKDLAGYITGGAFARDLETYFANRERETEYDADAKRAPTVFAKLPDAHRAAATAFDALVKSGTFPSLDKCDLSGYGFDCVANELYNATDARYYGLGYDHLGSLYLLDVKNGKVRRWIHDGDPFEDGEDFASLDGFAFALVRTQLVTDGAVASDDVAAVYERLGFGWLDPDA